jgi:hypothetical protein
VNQNFQNNNNIVSKLPTLRRLSDTPVGGATVETISTTTFVRWIDRGRGNIYEASNINSNITILSNTILPKVYESIWNKNMNTFVALSLSESTNRVTTLYSTLQPRFASTVQKKNTNSTSTIQNAPDTTVTPYELKGTKLPDNVISVSESPKKDKAIIVIKEGKNGVGYIATFDGKKMTKLFSTPLTEISVEWPEENTIAIHTSAGSNIGGFLYFINAKTGFMRKILGPLPGLSTKVSHDAKNVIVSVTGDEKNLRSAIYNVTTGKTVDILVNTLAEKCVWSRAFVEDAYCSVPSQIDQGSYPDDWYKGNVRFSDKIWQINSKTGTINMISNLLNQADRIIDGINLKLDDKDKYLIFMNKNDLTLWSLELASK